MSYMFCYECGVKFDGGVDDIYATKDRNMSPMNVPLCPKCSPTTGGKNNE